jgi:hypothetical protein
VQGRRSDGAVAPLAGAAVTVYQTGTTTPLALPVYAGPSGGTTLVNPLAADARGMVEFWLDSDERVDLYVVASGYDPITATVDVTSQDTLTAPTVAGNLAFGGTGQRITADLSNATAASRLLAQTTAANSTTNWGVIPSGSSTSSQFTAYNASDPNNASIARFFANGAGAGVAPATFGAGVAFTSFAFTGFTAYSFDGTLTVAAINKGSVPLNQTLQAILSSTTIPAATTQYATVGGGSATATENQRQTPIPRATTVRNLYFVTSAAQPGDGALTVTLRKNGVDTAVTLTVAAGAAAGTFSDLTHSVAFAAGDLLSIKLVNASPGTVSAAVVGWSVTTDA